MKTVGNNNAVAATGYRRLNLTSHPQIELSTNPSVRSVTFKPN